MSGGKPWGGPYSPKRPSRPSRPESRAESRTTAKTPDSLPRTESLPVYGERGRGQERPAPERRSLEAPSAAAPRDDWRNRLTSPAKTYDAAERLRRRDAGRARRIPWLGLPILLAALFGLVTGSPGLLVGNLGAWALLALGAHLIGQGQKAQEAYDARSMAAAPSLPRKLLGSLAVGAGVGLAATLAFGLMGPVMGFLSAGLALFAFGVDPMRAKGDAKITDVSITDLDAALTEARGRTTELDRIARALKDRSLGDAVREVNRETERILQRIEQDPGDLRRSRKFLKVYLDGVLEAARKYERAQTNVDPETEWKFRKLLRDMRQVAAEHYENLLNDDKTDLDVEIEVLADRLKHEAGV